MKTFFLSIGILGLVGCASMPAAQSCDDKEAGMRPINAEFHGNAIVFQVTSTDTSLFGVIQRWGRDAGIPVSITSAVDYPLIDDARIGFYADSFEEAARRLLAFYQGVRDDVQVEFSDAGLTIKVVESKSGAKPVMTKP